MAVTVFATIEGRGPFVASRIDTSLLQVSLFMAVVARTRALMARQLRHLVRLVDDLLDVARIRSGKIVLELERVELAAVISGAATRLIALSGYGQSEDRRRTSEAGFDAHLVKPVEHGTLRAALR